ncbi:MAG: MarR family transcriptional regulator [Candidatus Thorarchaeota archaeon]|nr:MAG: MarR family transcriptional regulator [Candidatus Thorarchaeota archaeon]
MMSQRAGGFLITQIHHLGRRVFTELLRKQEIEIGPGQGRILFALWQKDGVPINDLVERTLLRKSTLSELLDNLEKAGFVRREQSEEDRRKMLIRLTERTQKLQKVYINLSVEMTKLFYNGFTDEEIDEFETFLHRILDNLLPHDSEGNLEEEAL